VRNSSIDRSCRTCDFPLRVAPMLMRQGRDATVMDVQIPAMHLESVAKEKYAIPNAAFGDIVAELRQSRALNPEVIAILEAINTLRIGILVTGWQRHST
jgi:hypothetical protein